MKKSDKKWIIDHASNGIVTSDMVTKQKIHRSVLKEMCDSGYLEKYSRGLYVFPDVFDDEYYLTQQTYKRGIYSHETSLYLLDYSERVPINLHMTFPTNYNSPSLKDRNIIVTRVIPENYELGIIPVKTPYGNTVMAYDLERSLCDILRGQGEEIQTVLYAMKQYARSKNKNINKLMTYAKKLHVEQKVRRYMEVLL